MENRPLDLADLIAHDAWIRALARSLVADHDAAEDVVQDAYVAALERPPAEHAAIRPWFRRVVRNFATMQRRTRDRRSRREREGARPERLPSVPEIVEKEAARAVVSRSVLELDEPYRSTILYRYFENLPPRHIARELGISVVAVEGRLRRGLAQLRARLDKHHGGDGATWRMALGPLLSLPFGLAPAALGVPAAATVSGALLMSTKIKIAIFVVLAAATAMVCWPGDRDVPPSEPTREARAQPNAKAAAAKRPTAQQPDNKVAVPLRTTPPVASPTAARPLVLTPARGSIVGRVASQDGAPIRGATVRALAYATGALDFAQRRQTVTDAHGGYRLAPLNARCIIEVRAPDFHSARKLATPFSRVDFTLGKPGGVRGRVLRAGDRSPCEDALVALYRHRPDDAQAREIGGKTYYRSRCVTYARGDGAYEIVGVPRGMYQLEVIPPGLVENGSSPYTGAIRSGVQITGTARRTVDLQLDVGVPISGRITTPTGEAVADASIQVSRPNQNSIRYRIEPTSPRIARSAADGGFSVTGLDPSVEGYRVTVYKPGFASATRSAIKPGQRVPVTLHPLREVTGTVRTATGGFASEFRIQGKMTAGPGGTLKPRRPFVRTDGHFVDLDGRFTLQWLPGVYTVEAQTPDGQRSETRTIEIPEVGTAPHLELIVRTGASVSGTVLGPNRESVQFASVHLWNLDSTPPKQERYVNTGSHGAFTFGSLPSGTFLLYVEVSSRRMRGATAQRIVLHAGAPRTVTMRLDSGSDVNFAVRRRGNEPIRGARIRVERADGARVAMSLTRNRSFAAFHDARRKSRRPMTDGAQRVFLENDARRQSTTDAAGLTDALLLIPGEYVVTASAPGFKAKRRTFRVPGASTVTIDLVPE